MSGKAKVSRQRPARCRLTRCFEQSPGPSTSTPWLSQEKWGFVEISLQRPPPSWCKSLECAGGLERGCRYAGRPPHGIREPVSPAQPPWMDNPEVAGIGRRRRAPLCREAVGWLQNAAGGRRRYVQSRRKYVTPLCRKCEEPRGADVA